MGRTVLILTEPGDIHAFAVAEALRRKGGEAIIWHTADFPSVSCESILIEGQRQRISISGPELDLPDLDLIDPLTIWHRRPAFAVDRSLLHPADIQFAESECTIFRRSLLGVLAQDAFWVNPPDAAVRASRKLLQHRLALEVGLTMPDTLYSNDPAAIRDFIRNHGGRIIYKPFRGMPWRSKETYWAPYTSLLTADQLVPAGTLRNVPGIYQELVPKAYELRITMIGNRCLAAQVLSQETSDGRVDWRKAYSELRMLPYKLPADLEEVCRRLLNRLGLVFGCLDFIVTPAGDFVFLEINEMGQFLFVEKYANLPLLDAFSAFLLQGNIGFEWNETEASVRYAEVLPAVEDFAIRSRQTHVRPAEQCFPENE